MLVAKVNRWSHILEDVADVADIYHILVQARVPCIRSLSGRPWPGGRASYVLLYAALWHKSNGRNSLMGYCMQQYGISPIEGILS